MQKQITIEHMAGYVPYRLTVKCADTGETMILNGTSGDSTAECITVIGGEDARLMAIDKSEDYEEYIIPLLRPLSSLTKEITHNGETFVPIRSLLKTCIEQIGAIEDKYIDQSKCFEEDDTSNIKVKGLLFGLDHRDISFTLVLNSDCITTPNQYKLFQLLHSWHFDVFGLLEQNLAIPIVD